MKASPRPSAPSSFKSRLDRLHAATMAALRAETPAAALSIFLRASGYTQAQIEGAVGHYIEKDTVVDCQFILLADRSSVERIVRAFDTEPCDWHASTDNFYWNPAVPPRRSAVPGRVAVPSQSAWTRLVTEMFRDEALKQTGRRPSREQARTIVRVAQCIRLLPWDDPILLSPEPTEDDRQWAAQTFGETDPDSDADSESEPADGEESEPPVPTVGDVAYNTMSPGLAAALGWPSREQTAELVRRGVLGTWPPAAAPISVSAPAPAPIPEPIPDAAAELRKLGVISHDLAAAIAADRNGHPA